MSGNCAEVTDFSITCNETTSPSQLQEVTLDPDGTFNYTAGLHSPNGGPMRGRSIKEFEESLTALRKENFNLKLRIYFLEERMGTNFSMDKENAIKKNIELKVEVESLKKELAEKQELLCQAVKAMELDEDEHKKDSDEQQKTIQKLQKELEAMQTKLDEESRCQGDRGYDEEYYEAFNIPQKDCGHEAYLQELEAKVKDLEALLTNEKDTVRELENLLQLTDNRNANIAALDEELKQKDIQIRKFQADLEDRNKVVANYRIRVNKLEDDLIERKNDVDYITKQLKEKCLLVQELQNESEELHKLLSESQSSLSSERRKNEKHKISVHDRNKRIMELEEEVNTLSKKLSVAQTQYDAIKSEVQRKHDVGRRTPIANTDLSKFSVRDTPKQNVSRCDDNVQSAHQASLPQLRLSMSPSTPIQRNRSPKSTSRSPTTLDTSSSSNTFDVKDLNIDQLQKEVAKSRKHILKLERDQLKACRIIQTMLDTRKKNGKEIDELKTLVSKKDGEIEELAGKIGKYFNKEGDGVNIGANQSRTLAKITELKDNAKDNEPPVEANEDPKFLLEQYKELTDSLEEQKQVLLCTLEETRNQLREVESKFSNLQTEIKSRDNRIVDLEFEMLSLSQDIANNEAMEKSDVGNEKPTTFFIKEIEEKDREIEKLESELRKRTADLQAIVNKELWDKNRDIEKLQKRFNEILLGKDEEINNLERNVNSKNMQLDVIKRKIGELGMNVEEYEDSIQIIADQNHDINTLQGKLDDCQRERDFFKVQLGEYDDKLRAASAQMMADSHKYRSLESEFYQIRDELDKCERLRQDANEMCSVLCKRLEELAYFLDSLLKHKSVLGYLGSKKNDKLRALVNQTLDISRTLSLSMSLNPEQSLLQLSNISAVLNSSQLEDINEGALSELSIAPVEASLTYTSHFSQQQLLNNDDSKIIAALRAQVENLKKEIELRDTEASYAKEVSYISKLSVMKIENANKDDEDIMNVLMALDPAASINSSRVQSRQQIYDTLVCSKFNNSSEKSTTTIKCNADQNSESEAWSEPDRNVSRARMGIDDTISSKKSSISEPISTEDELDKSSTRSTLNRKTVLAESRQTIILLHAQIAELEQKLRVRETQLIENSEAAEEAAKAIRDEQLKVEKLTAERYELLEKMAETEDRLRSAESTTDDANSQLLELQNTIHEVQTSQKLLQDTLDIKNKETQNRINQLEQEKEMLNQHLREVQQIADEAKMDFIASEKKLTMMRKDMEYLEESIKAEWEQKLRTQEQNYEIKTKLIEHTAEAAIKKLNEQNLELQSKYDAECKNRLEVENLTETVKELEKFKGLVNVAEERIHSLEEQEETLRHKLEESESNYRAKVALLHEELEKVNLNYSETVLEKSRILTEKAELDSQLKEFVTKEAEFARQVREYKEDFANMKETFQKQVAHLEHQKSKLEVRVSVLEQQNAELKNKMVKMQAGDNESGKITPTTTSSRILELFLNKTVPPGYKSRPFDPLDDQVTVYSVPTVETTGPMDLERMQATSSPDLGIESDHGRFSSLETPATSQSRPFLKTLELTESMSNLLNNENDKQLANCNNDQCCEKTKEIVNENNDLRKKLLRTRKALEDTVGQLTVANQRKKQVEKTICKQIHKTSQVLRKAKANLDSGSDQDVLKK